MTEGRKPIVFGVQERQSVDLEDSQRVTDLVGRGECQELSGQRKGLPICSDRNRDTLINKCLETMLYLQDSIRDLTRRSCA